MALLYPAGKLILGKPNRLGMVTQFGFARDWRFNSVRDVFREKGCDWKCVHTEYIEPLGAIAPSGIASPVDMSLSDWTASNNDKFREVYVSGNPVTKWLEYYDGSVYAAATDLTTCTGVLKANTSQVGRWALSMVRFSPPPEQGIASYVTVSMSAARLESGVAVETGILSLVMPLHNDEYDRPLLHVIWGDPDELGLYDVFTAGTILCSAERGASMQQGESRETWLFEYEEDSTKYDGSHILIRSPQQLGQDKWWYYRAPDIQILDADLTILVAGHVCALNFAPIEYSWDTNSMWADADQARELPDADGWATSTTWGTVDSCPDDWDVTVAIPDGETGHRPRLSFTSGYGGGSVTSRPVCWFVYESADATIDQVDATEWDTNGEAVLQYLSWEWDATYRGCRGAARFAPCQTGEPFSWLRDNAFAEVHIGWQSGAGDDLERQLVATGYIMPFSEKHREGEFATGSPAIAFDIGDFGAARLPHKDVYDIRQAGGMTVEEFIEMAANRLGLGTHYWVDTTISDQVIPLGDPPSRPSFAPTDGDSWEQLFSAIETACDIRIGWDQDGDLFADTGPEEYDVEASTIVYTLDETSMTDGEQIYSIAHTKSASDFRNVLKAVAGKDDARTEYYWAENVSDRAAGIGDDWAAVLVDDETDTGGGIGNLEQQFLDRFYKFSDMIEWVGPARPTIRPDDFIAVDTVSDIAIPDGAIYQVVSHHIEADAVSFTATSTIRAVLVWDTASDLAGNAIVQGMASKWLVSQGMVPSITETPAVHVVALSEDLGFGDGLTASVVNDYEALRNAFPHSVVLASEIDTLRALKTVNSTYLAAHNLVVLRGDGYTDGGDTYGDTISYAIGSYASWELDAEYCMWSWLATGTEKYRNRCIGLAGYVRDNWSTSGASYGQLRVIARMLARIYDVCYDGMSADEKTNLLTTAETWGTALYDYITPLYILLMGPSTANCMVYLGQAAAALYNQSSDAQTWMTRVLAYFEDGIDGVDWPYYSGQTDGGLGNGLYYGLDNHRLRWELFESLYNLGFTDMWSNSFMSLVPQFMLYMEPPTLPFYGTFGDGGMSVHIDSAAKAARWDALWLAQVYQDAELQWWAEQRLIEGNAYTTYGTLPYHHNSISYPWQVLQYGLRETLSPVTPAAPSGNAYYNWPTTGFVAMHNNPADPATDTAMMLTARDYGSVHHQQADHLSFVLYHKGKPLAINSGYYGGLSGRDDEGAYSIYWAMQTVSKNAIVLVAETTLTGDINDTVKTLPVTDGSVFPATGPYLLSIWDGVTYDVQGLDEAREVVQVTSVTGNNVTVQWRGLDAGAAASAHTAGENVTLVLGQYDSGWQDRDADAAANAEQVVFTAGTGYQYWVGDATNAYNASLSGLATRVRRHVVFVSDVDEPFACILDELRLGISLKARYMLHCLEEPTANEVAQTVVLPYDDERGHVALFGHNAYGGGTDTLELKVFDESDTPCKYSSLDETPIDEMAAATQARIGWDWHVSATSPDADTEHIIGSVIYPYTNGEGSVPTITGQQLSDTQYELAVGSVTVTFTMADTPSVVVEGL